MIQTAIQPHEIGAVIRERTAVLLRMTALKLMPQWVTELSTPELTACCNRLAAASLDISQIPEQLQRELIQNPDFSSWLTRLLSLWGTESEPSGETEETSSARLDRSGLLAELSHLLEASWAHKQEITAYQPADVLALLEQIHLSYSAKLAYLTVYTSRNLSAEWRAQIVENLAICGAMPVPLSEEQWTLPEEPFVGTHPMFAKENFAKNSELFRFCPELADIARLLRQEAVSEDLQLVDYMYFAEDAPEYLRLLTSVLHQLGNESMGMFIRLWQENACALSELRCMDRRTQANSGKDWSETLATYSGYVNLLYGDRFKSFSIANLTSYQEKLLACVIINNKKHFIRLIDGNGERFLSLPRNTILFSEKLYRSHFNLNELAERDLADCAQMTVRQFPEKLLEDSRQYTFAELKLLYDAPKAYATLYGFLQTDDLDHRVRVLRQFRKRDALKSIENVEELSMLAGYLDQATLYDWQRNEFWHIKGLTTGDMARMLVHLNELRHLLPTMQCRTDAVLALRSLESLAQFDSMDALKANLLHMDEDWPRWR